MRQQPELNQSQRKVDALLRFAAGYPVEGDAPEGLAAYGLARWQTRKRKRAAVVRAGATALVPALVSIWTCVVFVTSRSRENVYQDVAQKFAQSPNPKTTVHVDGQPLRANRHDSSSNEPSTSKISAKSGRASIHRTARSARSDELRAHRHRPPRTYWQVATVHRYETELITPAVLTANDRENGTVIVQPAMLRIPVEIGEAVLEGQNTWRLTPINRIATKENQE